MTKRINNFVSQNVHGKKIVMKSMKCMIWVWNFIFCFVNFIVQYGNFYSSINFNGESIKNYSRGESAALGHFSVSIFVGQVDNKESKNKYSSIAVWFFGSIAIFFHLVSWKMYIYKVKLNNFWYLAQDTRQRACLGLQFSTHFSIMKTKKWKIIPPNVVQCYEKITKDCFLWIQN